MKTKTRSARLLALLLTGLVLPPAAHSADAMRVPAVTNAVELPGGANPGELPVLQYHPEGDAIVARDGTRWNNRPLYCNARLMVIMAGEMPGLTSPLGTVQAGAARGSARLKFEEFGQRVMRYRPGRMEWELSDPRIPGLTVTMMATTVAEGDGFVVEARATGAKPGDETPVVLFPSGDRERNLADGCPGVPGLPEWCG